MPDLRHHVTTISSLGLLLILPMLLGGCAVWNFIDTRYQNVTGYFNSYYNASTLFSEAQEEIAAQERSFEHPRDAGVTSGTRGKGGGGSGSGADDSKSAENVRLMRREYAVPGPAMQKLDKVIEKCSRILVSYPKSKWIDNALLLIGKAYFYRKDYVKAERKFNELINQFPDGSLTSEAVLWLGKTRSMEQQYDLAETALNRAIDMGVKENNAEVVAEAYYAMGEMYLDREMENDAVKNFKRGAEIAGSTEQRLRIQIALAREQEKLGNKEEAAKAYRDIIRLGPGKDQAFIAELNYSRLCRETGQFEECANTLLDMIGNPSYIPYDGKIQLEIGHYFVAVEEYIAAVDQYTFVDTTFKQTPESGEAGYAMGQLYELKLKNYDKAFEKYTRARQASQGTTAGQESALRADIFGEYRKFRNAMYDADTLLYFVLHPDSLARRDSLQVIADSLYREEHGTEVTLTEEQKAQERFARRRPHGRNTGRINPYAVVTTQAGAGKGPQVTSASSQPAYRRLDIARVPPDSVLAAISAMRMEMGWMMMDKIGNLDSAAYYYSFALQGRLPDSSIAKAYFTLAEIARRQGDEKLSLQYEDLLIASHPQTRYAWSIMVARGLDPPDTVAFLRRMYNQAAALLERGDYTAGITGLERIISQYPNTEQAMRARLAIGMTYELSIRDSSKALAYYRGIVADNPKSPFAKRPQEVLDAISGKTRPRVDSTAIATPAPTPKDTKKDDTPRVRPKRFQDEDVPTQDSTGTKPKYDPSNDRDFPLGLPGDEPTAPEQKPGKVRGTNPGDVRGTNPGELRTPDGAPPATLPPGKEPVVEPPTEQPPPQGRTP